MDVFNEDRYISYNEYKNFCVENNVQFDEKILKEKNDKFINKNLIDY